MLLAYQNCGQNSSFHPELVETNPNSPAENFLSKISEDADLIIAAQEIRPGSCKIDVPECALDSGPSLNCIKETVKAYYEGLECAGFQVYEASNCIAAVSNDEPQAMEPVLVDMTCFNQEEDQAKSLNLGVCYGEDIGFSQDGPSSGMRISAWMDLGNEYPYSRQLKQIVLYPNQKDIVFQAAEIGNGSDYVDACGKTRNVNPLSLQIPMKLSEVSAERQGSWSVLEKLN